MKRYRIFIALSAAAIALGLFACAGKPKGEPITPVNGIFSIDAGKIGAGGVKFFNYGVGGKYVEFLLARAESGGIKAAFDACITCYSHKMGYRQDGDSVVCIYCGNRFRLEELDKGVGNCIPIKINFRMEGPAVIIDQKEIEAGAVWF